MRRESTGVEFGRGVTSELAERSGTGRKWWFHAQGQGSPYNVRRLRSQGMAARRLFMAAPRSRTGALRQFCDGYAKRRKD